MTYHGLVLDMLQQATGKPLGYTDVDFVLCGIESHVCVLQTVQDLRLHGARVHVVRDGISSCNHGEVGIAVQVGRSLTRGHARCRCRHFHLGIDPVPNPRYVETLIKGTADHPQFKAISTLIVCTPSHPARHKNAHGPGRPCVELMTQHVGAPHAAYPHADLWTRCTLTSWRRSSTSCLCLVVLPELVGRSTDVLVQPALR